MKTFLKILILINLICVFISFVYIKSGFFIFGVSCLSTNLILLLINLSNYKYFKNK